jgi:DNA-3-methyladenine glycosylase I
MWLVFIMDLQRIPMRGTPVYDDATFWILLLETLSWVGLFLIKEKNFRAAFDQFDYKKIATYNDDKIRFYKTLE